MAESFPALTLAPVCGAIAHYLANRAEVDQYLRDGELTNRLPGVPL